jgi:hypothetical protein
MQPNCAYFLHVIFFVINITNQQLTQSVPGKRRQREDLVFDGLVLDNLQKCRTLYFLAEFKGKLINSIIK